MLHRVAACLYRAEHNGMYYALFKRGGKQIRRSLKTTDRQLAERKLNGLREKVARLNTGAAANVPFSVVIKGRLKDGLAKTWLDIGTISLKPSSVFRREMALCAVASHFNGTVRSITTAQIEQWAAKRSREVAARTFNMELESLSLVMQYAVREGMILDNPAAGVQRMKLRHPKILIPGKDQFSKILDSLRNEPRSVESAYLVEFLGYSGCRLGEAVALTWGDVDFNKGTLTVSGGEQGTKNREFRTVPLFPALRRLLQDLRANLDHEPSHSGKVFLILGARTSLSSASTELEFPHFTYHSLRHFFCSNAIEAGIDFKVIASWLGHKDGGVLVAKTYGHLRDEHSTAMAKRMTFDAAAASEKKVQPPCKAVAKVLRF